MTPPLADANVIVCQRPEDLSLHIPAWEALAADAIEPNPFHEPWVLLPAWRAFGSSDDIRVVLLFEASKLNGLVVLQHPRRFRWLPVSFLRSWTHRHGVLGTPLLRSGAESRTLEQFFRWLRQADHGASVLEIGQHAADGTFARVFAEVTTQLGLPVHLRESYERALLLRGQAIGDSPADVMSSGNRKELRRQRRRLEETGRLEVRTLDAGGDAERWIRDFMSLERSGWKGREATAMGSDAVQREYFEQIAQGAHNRGRLMMIGLFLDDRPIALKFNLLAPPGSFAFKIAFDESLARFSPGVQLELENIAAVGARGNLEWMDSCASHRHFMIERLWSGRRVIATTIVATGRSRSATALVRRLPALHELYKKTRPARRAFRAAFGRRLR